jgi:hypothetical protein
MIFLKFQSYYDYSFFLIKNQTQLQERYLREDLLGFYILRTVLHSFKFQVSIKNQTQLQFENNQSSGHQSVENKPPVAHNHIQIQ